MIYFTSDTHFYHNAIIDHCNRPIPGWMNRDERVEEMHRQIIEAWNTKITSQDEVYHLGDLSFAGVERTQKVLDQLNGTKYLIRGNHDNPKESISKYFKWVKDYYVLKVHDTYEVEGEDNKVQQYHQPIVLSHFPFLSWDNMAHGSWHLHGHCHGSLKDTGVMRLDVGVDTNKMAPYSYEDIKHLMILRTVTPVDHHKPRNAN